MKHWIILTAIVAALLISVPVVATAETVTADFDDGNGTSAVDAYMGMEGDGWAGPWQELRSKLSNEPQTNIVVRTSSETSGTYDDDYAELVPGSGNYLYMDAHMNENAVCSLTVARDFGGESGIDRTRPYSIEFLYRVDEDNFSSNFTESNDQYQIYDWPTIRGGTTTEIGWGIKASGTNPIWRFYNGDGRNGTTNLVNYIESGVPVVADHVFKFEVSVDPVNSSWAGKVTDLTTGAWGEGTDMGYRFDSTGDPPRTPSTLMQFHTRGTTKDEERRYSIDAIKIQQVPEPTMLVMFLGMLAMGVARRGRK